MAIEEQQAETSQEEVVQEESEQGTQEETEEQEETQDESASSEEEQEESDEQKEEKSKDEFSEKVKRRIDKIVKQREDARREAQSKEAKIAALEARLLELSAKPDKKESGKTSQAQGDQEPKLDDFDDYSAYIKAVARWEVRQESKQSQESARQNQEKSAYEKSVEAHSKRLQEMAKTTPDLEEALEDLVEIAGSLAPEVQSELEAVILESEKSAEVTYYLAKNPKEIERISKLSPRAIAKEIGRIEATLEKPGPKKEVKKTNAPKPIAPVSGRSSGAAKDISDPNIPFKDFERIREQQERKRQGA